MGVTFISLSCFCGCSNKETVSANSMDTTSNNKIDGDMEEAEDTLREIVVPSEYDPTGVTNPIRFPEEVYPELKKSFEEESPKKEEEENEVTKQTENGNEPQADYSGTDITSLPDDLTDEGIKLNSLSICHFPSDLPLNLSDTSFSEDTKIVNGKRNITADTSLFSFDGKAYSSNVPEQYLLYFDIDDENKISAIYADCQFLFDKIEDGSEVNIDYERYQIPQVNVDEQLAEEGISDNSADVSDNTVEENKDSVKDEAKDKKEANEAIEKELTPEEQAELLIQNRKDYLRQISIGGVSLGMTESQVKSVIGSGKDIDGLSVYKNKSGALIISYKKDSKGYLGEEEFVYQIVFIANQNVNSEE